MVELDFTKALLAAGTGAWLLLNVANHLTDAAGTRFFIGQFMRMESLSDIDTPLRRRAISAPGMYRTAFVVIVAAQAIVGIALLLAAVALIAGAPNGPGLAVLAFGAFSGLWLIFLLAGAWFGYWIKMDGLQRTHLILLGIGIAGTTLATA